MFIRPDERIEKWKLNLKKQKTLYKEFLLTEQVCEIYKQNIALQKKLDDIKFKGTGISNLN